MKKQGKCSGMCIARCTCLRKFQLVDLVHNETTCDAKKKTWEISDRLVPTHVMEILQMKKKRDKTLWVEEVENFKDKVE